MENLFHSVVTDTPDPNVFRVGDVHEMLKCKSTYIGFNIYGFHYDHVMTDEIFCQHGMRERSPCTSCDAAVMTCVQFSDQKCLHRCILTQHHQDQERMELLEKICSCLKATKISILKWDILASPLAPPTGNVLASCCGRQLHSGDSHINVPKAHKSFTHSAAGSTSTRSNQEAIMSTLLLLPM